MKNIAIIIFAILLMGLISCSKDSPVTPEPDPEPKPDYSKMPKQIFAKIVSWQTAINEKRYDDALKFTLNPSKTEFSSYPKSSISSQVEDKSKITITLSSIKEKSTSTVGTGQISITGDAKIVIEDLGVPKIEFSTTFESIVFCTGDKMLPEDWKIKSLNKK